MSSLFSSEAKAWKCETSFKLEKSPATKTSSDYKICENLSETFYPVKWIYAPDDHKHEASRNNFLRNSSQDFIEFFCVETWVNLFFPIN